MDRIIEILKTDINRIELLKIVHDLQFPQCYIAAGFIRNLMWDYSHGYESTELNDIDVIYYNSEETSHTNSSIIENELNKKYPQYNWDVKNQALMHIKNNDNKYKNTLESMSYWPEKETAIGARIIDDNDLEIISAFDIKLQFSNTITHNPKRAVEIFDTRVKNKKWVNKWPNLKVIYL